MSIRKRLFNPYVVICGLILLKLFVVIAIYRAICLPDKDPSYDQLMDGSSQEIIISVEFVTHNRLYKSQAKEDIDYILLLLTSPAKHDSNALTSGLTCNLYTKTGKKMSMLFSFNSAPYGELPKTMEIWAPDLSRDSVDIHERAIPRPIPELFQ